MIKVDATCDNKKIEHIEFILKFCSDLHIVAIDPTYHQRDSIILGIISLLPTDKLHGNVVSLIINELSLNALKIIV